MFGPLPAGWERREDPLGRNYYVDHNTRTTMWHLPRFNEGVNNVEQQAETSQARDRHNRRRLVDEALGYGDPSTQAPPSSKAMSHIAAQHPRTSSLPAGWEKRKTPEGRVYFVDRMSSFNIYLGAKAK